MKLKDAAAKPVGRVSDYRLLERPVITEKSSIIGGAGTCLGFFVDPRVTKTEIKEAVERAFQVKVAGVRTMNTMGKRKRTTGRVGRTAKRKKAYVTLQEGYSIDLVEGL
jgi:large subunit ribosomal protein L23